MRFFQYLRRNRSDQAEAMEIRFPDQMIEEKEVPFYKKKEYYGIAALVLGGVKQFTAPHTVSHQVSDYLITVGLPLVMSYFGLSDAKKYGTPSGISKLTSSFTSSANRLKDSFVFKNKN